jgi:hypothetical protein
MSHTGVNRNCKIQGHSGRVLRLWFACPVERRRYAWPSERARVQKSKSFFFVITVEEIAAESAANKRAVKALPGTQKFHSVRDCTIPNHLEVRNRGCCCLTCMGDGDDCEWKKYTDPWCRVKLKSATTEDEELVAEMEDHHRHHVAEALLVDEVFAISADDPTQQFSLVRVTEVARECTAEESGMEDALGKQVCRGEWFITGNFLEWSVGPGRAQYVVDLEHTVYIPTHLVCVGPVRMVDDGGQLQIHEDDQEEVDQRTC